MYRCERCGSVSKPRSPMHHLVVEVREVSYPFRKDVHRVKRQRKDEWKDDPGGSGSEPVRELRVCEACSRL